MKVAVFDLDGVLFDPSVRKRVYEVVSSMDKVKADTKYEQGHYLQYDKVIEGSLETVCSLKKQGYDIAYLSGRRITSIGATTNILFNEGFPEGAIHLKPNKDYNTVQFKKEILSSYLGIYDEVLFVDDTKTNRQVGINLGISSFSDCESLMLNNKTTKEYL